MFHWQRLNFFSETKGQQKNTLIALYNAFITNIEKRRGSDYAPGMRLNLKTPNGIHISVSQLQKKTVLFLLSVRDNGLGIQEKELENVFNMYERIHENIEGKGVGLYLVKKIVDASGGKVAVESKVGEGSNFKIYFKA